MLNTLLQFKIYIVTGWILIFLLLENFLPYAVSPFHGSDKWARWGRNVGLFAINIFISPLIVVPISVWATYNGLDWRPHFMPEFWANGWSLVADILLLDFFIYWWHRVNHRIPFLWRFHEVHHLDEFLDVTSATRFHFGEVILSALVRGGFIFLLDIPLYSVLIFETVVLICAIFQHSNVNLPAGLSKLLSYVIVTPDWHWQHHHAVREDTDSHYGTMLTVWDRLFNSRAVGQRTKTMKIGVEGRKERGIRGLLLRPLDKA